MSGNVKRGNMYFPAKEIVPGLWIGSKGNATSASWVRDHNIKFIVNVSRDIPTPFTSAINTYRIPVDDARDENGAIIKHWPITSAAIDDVLSHGGGVLVHCYAGIQRSAATVTAYLMWKRCLTARDAMKLVNSKKGETFNWGQRATFWEALKKWEDELRRQGRVGGRVGVSACPRAVRAPHGVTTGSSGMGTGSVVRYTPAIADSGQNASLMNGGPPGGNI